MTFTPIIPAATRLDGDLQRGEAALAQARADMEAAGPDASAYSRTVIYPGSPEAVDALASRWGTRAEWRAGDSQYTAFTGNSAAELEAVWFRPAAPAGNEAAA